MVFGVGGGCVGTAGGYSHLREGALGEDTREE